MLYVRIDLHRKSSQLAVVNNDGELVASRRVRSRPEEVWRVFGELPSEEPVEAVFEATFGYGWLADLLADAGIPAHMAHPLATKAIASGRVKNDKVDAAILAQLLRTNLLPEGWIAPLETREARRLVSDAGLAGPNAVAAQEPDPRGAGGLRSQTRGQRVRSGRASGSPALFGKEGRAWLSQQELPQASRQRVDINLRVIEGLDGEIRG
jgi:transposase